MMFETTTRHTIACLLALGLCALSTIAQARRNPMQAKEAEDFNPPPYMELAQQSLVEGDLPAAIRVMKAAQACWAEHFETCGFTAVDFDSLAGVVYLERGMPEKAVLSLESVVAAQPNRSMAWFYLGQAYLHQSRYQDAARALTGAQSAASKLPQYHAMLVRAWLGAGEPEKARGALSDGLLMFPRDAPLLFEGTRLFLDQGLTGAASDLARRYASASEERAELAFLIVAEALRSRGFLRDATRVLEEARLLCGAHGDAAVRLAYVRAEMGDAWAAARLFEEAAAKRPELALAASEQYRIAGHTLDALRTAARIADEPQRRSQLAAVYLQEDFFDAALEVLRPLASSGGLDQQGTYRMAYAAFRAGRLDLATRTLLAVDLASFGGPKRQLLDSIEACKATPWNCW